MTVKLKTVQGHVVVILLEMCSEDNLRIQVGVGSVIGLCKIGTVRSPRKLMGTHIDKQGVGAITMSRKQKRCK